jgi:pilus assembly protein CpaF
MAGMPMSQLSIRSQIASAIHIIVQVQRYSDGTRRVSSITEMTGLEGDVVQMQEIYRFRVTGMTPDSKVVGEFRATGVRPRFLEGLSGFNLNMPKDAFEPGHKLG